MIDHPLALPGGTVLKNRIAKSAMSENMSDRNHGAGQAFVSLYHRWAQGGAERAILRAWPV